MSQAAALPQNSTSTPVALTVSNSVAIEGFYNNILKRTADADGLAAWVALADGGMSLDDIRAVFIASAEVIATIDPLVRIYEAAFGRLPDQAGLEGWATEMRAGATFLSIAEGFTNSPEFAARYPEVANGDLSGFVTGLYQRTLGRDPEAAGLEYWVTSGKSTAEILVGFSESQEFHNRSEAQIDIFLSAVGQNNAPSPVYGLFDIGSSADLSGDVVDGKVAGSTVGIDVNGNGVIDAGEPTAITDDAGDFSFPDGTPVGNLIATGGTDISTGLAFTGQLEAPSGSKVITPLTTVIKQLADQDTDTTKTDAEKAADAQTQLKELLGFSAVTGDLTQLDFVTEASEGDSSGADGMSDAQATALYASSVQILNIIAQGVAVITGVDGSISDADASAAVFKALTEALKNQPAGTTVDFSTSTATDNDDTNDGNDFLTNLFKAAASDAGLTGDNLTKAESIADSAAKIAASANKEVQDIIDELQTLDPLDPNFGDTAKDSLVTIVKTQKVTQGEASDDLKAAAGSDDPDGNADGVADAVGSDDGSGFADDSIISSQNIGDIDGDGTDDDGTDGSDNGDTGGVINPDGGTGTGGGGAADPAIASLSGSTLDLSFAPNGATLTTDGTNVTITGAGATAATFALADFDTIDLNGLALEMSGATVDQLFPDFNAGQIDVIGLGGGGGTLNITSVDFGDIEKETLKSPNLWLSDQNAASPVIAGFTFSEIDGDQSILPDGVTVNGTVEDAFKAWWDSFDDFYAGGSNYYNTLINTQFVYLGNDYATYLDGGGEAFLDVVKTSGDYTSRQQTLHDNLLGNLGDGAIFSRFGIDPADDPRTVDGQSFGDRGYVSGNANTLVQFEIAKSWDETHGVNRADLDIELTADDALSGIASDGSTMWSGTGISNDDFRIVRNTDAQIELAIKAAERKLGDYPDSASTDLIDGSYYKNISPAGWDAPSWNVPGGGDPADAENVARWSFNFSIATNYDGTAADSGEPTLADYEFQLVFDVDPTEGTSFVTYYLDDTDGGNWLFEGAEDANVAAAMNAILLGDLTNPIISDNVGENELDDPIYVAQNSQNYGFANSFEILVNAFLGNAYNNDGSKIAGQNYWEAETHPGEFQIGLEAYTLGGAELLAENYITVGQDTELVSLKDGDGAGSVTWVTDRRAVDLISTVSDPEDGSNSVFSFNIDEGAEQSGFYRYQGAQIKSDDGNHFVDAAQGSSVSVDFYTDAAWSSDGEAQQTGVWVVTNYDDPATKAVENDRQYPIAEYLDADALAALVAVDPDTSELINGTLAADVDLNGNTGLIRFWNSEEGWDDFVAVSLEGWNNLTFDLENNSHVWSLNDQEVYRYEGPLTQKVDVIETIIINSVNHGEDQTYLFDNLEITGVSTDDYYYG